MSLIKEEDKKFLSDEFNKYLKDNVDLIVFTSDSADCKYCKETVQLASEVADISDKINITIYNIDKDREIAEQYAVEKFPTTIVEKSGEKDGRIKYSGLPSGYEFGSLIDDIKSVSSGEADVSSKAIEIISKIDKPITIKVFVTPTCPYCPKAVETAHKFALLNRNITGEMVESLEFENEAEEAGVSSVPHIVINGDVQFVGAYPDEQFAEYVMEAYNQA